MFLKFKETIINMDRVIKVTSTYEIKSKFSDQEEAVCVWHDDGTSTLISPMSIDQFSRQLEWQK